MSDGGEVVSNIYSLIACFINAVDIVEKGRTQQRTKEPAVSPARTKCRRLQSGGQEETRLEDDLEERSLQSVLNLAQQQLELEAQVAELFSNSAQMSGNVLNLNWGRSGQKKSCFTRKSLVIIIMVCLPYC